MLASMPPHQASMVQGYSADPAIEPGSGPAEAVELVVALLEAVRLARVDDQFVRDVVVAQGLGEEAPLARWHARVFAAVEDEDGVQSEVEEPVSSRSIRVLLFLVYA